jgi:hypothetical protein
MYILICITLSAVEHLNQLQRAWCKGTLPVWVSIMFVSISECCTDTESLVVRTTEPSYSHHFANEFKSFLHFPSPDYKTLPTSLQPADATMYAGPVGLSLISRVMNLACTFCFKSRFMNNQQPVEVERNDDPYQIKIYEQQSTSGSWKKKKKMNPYFKQNHDTEMEQCVYHLVGAHLWCHTSS